MISAGASLVLAKKRIEKGKARLFPRSLPAAPFLIVTKRGSAQQRQIARQLVDAFFRTVNSDAKVCDLFFGYRRGLFNVFRIVLAALGDVGEIDGFAAGRRLSWD